MATDRQPLSSIDYGLRGAAITGLAGAGIPLAYLIAKLLTSKRDRERFNSDAFGSLGKLGTNMAVAGTLGAIPGGIGGYRLGKFINDSKEQQARLYRDQMLADYINQNGIPT